MYYYMTDKTCTKKEIKRGKTDTPNVFTSFMQLNTSLHLFASQH